MSVADADALEFVEVRASDAAAAPLLTDLGREYDERYARFHRDDEETIKEIDKYSAEVFDPPHGCFLVLRDGDETIAGGAFMRYDDQTAEFKRIWTSPDHRGRGLARRVLTELEDRARLLGYFKIFLYTGPCQPEAVSLYLATGYTPLFDPSLTALEIGTHEFVKDLVPQH